jgi:hypothetical protein
MINSKIHNDKTFSNLKINQSIKVPSGKVLPSIGSSTYGNLFSLLETGGTIFNLYYSNGNEFI